jgi:hypothetical protein
MSKQTTRPSLSNVKLSDETQDGSRVCQACKRTRPLVLFAKGRGRRGLICQGCYDSYKAERLRTLRLEKSQHDGMRAFPAEVRRKAQQLWSRARLNAWRKGVLFDISQQWVASKIMAGHCEVTGLPFEFENNYGTSRNPFAPSLDRRNPSNGYTPDNCQVVVWMYNCAKSDGAYVDVLIMAQAMVEKDLENKPNLWEPVMWGSIAALREQIEKTLRQKEAAAAEAGKIDQGIAA